jgi:Flp pilus assembly protein TadG
MRPRVQAAGGMTLGHGRQDERMMAPSADHGACSRVGRPAWAVVVESVPEQRLSPIDRALRRPSLHRRDDAHGQSLVEFALVLIPLLLILLGIIQMGLVFNAQVTITNAAREGARSATIYIYSSGLGTKTENDEARNDAALASVTSSMGMLSTIAPQFATASGTWVSTGTAPNVTYTSGDIAVAYSNPSGTQDSDPRTGERVTVQITYHQDLFVPLISAFLPHDSNGRLAQGATVTMVIN